MLIYLAPLEWRAFAGHLSRCRGWWPYPGPGGTCHLPFLQEAMRAELLASATTLESLMFGTWHQALLLENFGPKTEQQKSNQSEEAGQVHPSSVSAGMFSKAGAQAVPATPVEMLPLMLLGGRLSLSATNTFIISFKKTSLLWLMGSL